VSLPNKEDVRRQGSLRERQAKWSSSNKDCGSSAETKITTGVGDSGRWRAMFVVYFWQLLDVQPSQDLVIYEVC